MVFVNPLTSVPTIFQLVEVSFPSPFLSVSVFNEAISGVDHNNVNWIKLSPVP